MATSPILLVLAALLSAFAINDRDWARTVRDQYPPDDFAGQWKGIGTQWLGEKLHAYEVDFSLTADPEQDSAYLITSYISENGAFASMVGEGRLLRDGSFKFRETEIVRDSVTVFFSWCLKRATLDVNMIDGVLTMTGTVYADTPTGPCSPGDFVMRKSVVRP